MSVLNESSIELQAFLDADEKLIWTGKPSPKIRFRDTDTFNILLHILWTAGAVAWVAVAVKKGAPNLLAAMGVPFILAGLYQTFGRFFFDAKKRKTTVYGLTNKRFIIKTFVFKTRVRYVDLNSIESAVVVNERKDGSGSLNFRITNKVLWGFIRNVKYRSIDRIENVQDVYDKLKETLKR